MFTNQSSREINLKLIYVGPGAAGEAENLQVVYDRTEPEAKGKLTTAESGAQRTVFFDFLPQGLGEIRGFRVRVHLYAVASAEDPLEAAAKLAGEADGLVFVADCSQVRVDDDVAALVAVKSALGAPRWAEIPRVFQLNGAQRAGALGASELQRALGLEQSEVVVADTRDGSGVFDTLEAAVRALLVGMKDGRVHEWQPSDEQRAAGEAMTARVQVVSHCAEFLGEGEREFGPFQPEPRKTPFYVMLHPATAQRPYVTWATFGLSTEPQAPGGPEPRVELLAYAEHEDKRVPQCLFDVATMIATAPADLAPVKTFDTVQIGDPAEPDNLFALVPPDEAPGFGRFPDRQRCLADLRFTTAVGEASDEEARVTFLKLLPLTVDEVDFANDRGPAALLRYFEGRPACFGWGRGPGESVLAGGRAKRWGKGRRLH